MQKLTIEQFQCVQPCTIEFDRMLVLTGENIAAQDSIAGLIDFFWRVRHQIKGLDEIDRETSRALRHTYFQTVDHDSDADASVLFEYECGTILHFKYIGSYSEADFKLKGKLTKTNERGILYHEYPEYRLHPTEQKRFIEHTSAFASNPESKVVITTHSPYILATLNVLMFAYEVAVLNPDAKELEIVSPEFRLVPKHKTAYEISKDCKSIIDTETGMIDQNSLDRVSIELGYQFDSLYNAYTK